LKEELKTVCLVQENIFSAGTVQKNMLSGSNIKNLKTAGHFLFTLLVIFAFTFAVVFINRATARVVTRLGFSVNIHSGGVSYPPSTNPSRKRLFLFSQSCLSSCLLPFRPINEILIQKRINI